jgi:hypothetical protein
MTLQLEHSCATTELPRAETERMFRKTAYQCARPASILLPYRSGSVPVLRRCSTALLYVRVPPLGRTGARGSPSGSDVHHGICGRNRLVQRLNDSCRLPVSRMQPASAPATARATARW